MVNISGPVQNEDCTNFFIANRIGDTNPAERVIADWIEGMARAGIPTLFLNTAAQRTNYRSDVWEAFWDGFDPEADNEQPFLRYVPPDTRPRYRNMIENMLTLHEQGVDYPDEVTRRCRQKSISPWISLRMNDVHCQDIERHPFHSTLWREHPELHREGVVGYFARAFDFAHEAVRDRMLALVVETLSRYDVDGLELDFMREPYLFSKGREESGREALSEWVAQVRELCAQAATQRGHAVGLAVRVPSSPETSTAMGIDAVKWADDGLVDLLVAAPRWSTAEFDIPIEAWRAALGDTDVTLAGGLDVRVEAYPGGPLQLATPEHAAGAAAQILAAGADLVYLFNYFRTGHPEWTAEQYDRTVAAMADLQSLAALPRRHAVTYRDTVAPYEWYTPPLPAGGPTAELSLPTGPALAADDAVRLDILLRGDGKTHPVVTASINGVELELLSQDPDNGALMRAAYAVPADVLSPAVPNTICLQGPDAPHWQVETVEVSIDPAGAASA